MTVALRCGTIVPGCAVVLHGKSEDDILIVAFDHLKTAHNVDHVSVDLRQKLKTAIETDDPGQQARA
jgi:predicted small metal-binding protein